MNNKSIWITGASSGIGRALAIKFAKEGWQVAISARRENLLNEISQNNENIKPFPLDVTDSEKCKYVFEDIKKKIGEIDISVFCTGIHDPKSEKTLNLEKVKKIMDVNFFGTVNSINSVYEYYKNKKWYLYMFVKYTKMKNNKKVITPLTEEMKSILQLIPKTGEYVFTTTYGLKSLNCFSKIKSRLIDISGIQNWTFHDFRRSMATFLGDKGYEYHNIMLVLNHSDHSVTSIYNRSNQFKKKYETLTFWNDNFNNKLHFNKAYIGGVGPSYLKG